MSDFITELTRQFHSWQDETQYLARSDVADLVAHAAARSLDGNPPARISLHREIDPELEIAYHVLSGEDWMGILTGHEVATLRAILATYDETRPPQPGDPLLVAMETEDGRVVTEWEG